MSFGVGNFMTAGLFRFTTISSSQNNFNAFTAHGSPTSPGTYVVNINSGVILGSTSTATASFITGTFPAGSVLVIRNNGQIQGKGGAKGNGGIYNIPSDIANPGAPGGTGGDAVDCTTFTRIINGGTIGGGGGGGGGGGAGQGCAFGHTTCDCCFSRGDGGNGGFGAGQDSTRTNGSGGPSPFGGGTGGNGGTLGVNGGGGATGNSTGGGVPGSGGAPGTRGFYATGNSNILWVVNGTRLGQVS